MGLKIADSLVVDMTADRNWWRLRAADVESLVSRSGGSSVRWSRNRIEWVGVSWDGASPLRVGEHAVVGGAIKRLLSQLEPKIEKLNVPSVRAPTAGDVRACAAGLGEHERLTIDVDFEDFILPIAIAATAFDGAPASLGSITEGVLRHVEAAARNREPIARREAALRRALEETSQRIGAGCAPLWLRLDPAAFDERPDLSLSRHYKLVMTVLDDSLCPCTGGSLVGADDRPGPVFRRDASPIEPIRTHSPAAQPGDPCRAGRRSRACAGTVRPHDDRGTHTRPWLVGARQTAAGRRRCSRRPQQP